MGENGRISREFLTIHGEKPNYEISYIKASKHPLSADVCMVEGEKYLYLFDVGNDETVASVINGIPKKKIVVLSHFHPDHMGNLGRIEFETVYAGANTEKYFHQYLAEYESGQNRERYKIVTEPMRLNDGVTLDIYPVPSSHAKGSLLLQAEEKYIFIGDAIYSTNKNGQTVYNAQLLLEEMKLLKELPGDTLFLSHEKRPLKGKEGVLRFLEGIYKRRKTGEPYICVD